MTDLRLAAEIALRTLAIVAAAEVAQRTLLRDARHVRRLWLAALFAIAAVALAAVVDWKPSLPRIVTTAPVRQLAANDVRIADAQPWEHPRYRHDSRRVEVVVGYWLGAAGVALLVIISLLSFRGLRRASVPALPRIVGVARELGARCMIAFAAVDAPCTVGVMRSIILLPRASEHWADAKLRAAIAHELAHVRQRDSLWMTFGWAICAAMWFAPGAWIARRRLRAACELASDAAAASAGGDARVYAQTLIEIAEAAARRVPLAANMAGSVSLTARVEWLVKPRRPAFRVAALLIVPLTLAAFDWQVRLTSFAAAKPLLADTRSPDPGVRARALFRLARWQGRGDEVLPILIDALGDDASTAAVPRWDYNRDGWAPARSTLVHPSPGEVAAIGLASLSSIAAEPLAERLRDRNPVVRRNAAWALGELRHPRGIGRHEEAALIAALRDSDAVVRAAAACSLGDINVSSASIPLENMLAREADPAVRREASVALAAIRQSVSSEYFRHKE
ncbi:MAG: hypothetical protein DMF56_24125 [Acidobacteria bacterium]|nr:MAG: hypothetical protein DMF56_24125 [Acidobacteriota bacterium]